MSDLISKSALIDALKVHFDSCFREDGELLYSDHICTSDDVVDLIKLVENQPTAYDMDKVISQLGDYGNEEIDYYRNTPYENCIRECVSKAIEIVKQGGDTDDVCEWKKYPFDWFTGCDSYKIHNKQGDYCPRCGKKIKIVGD